MKSRVLQEILIVDDIEENRRMLANILKTHTDYKIMTASSGPAILNIVGEEPPDLILLDIMMPHMDGFEVATRLRQMPRTSEVPIIFITARTDQQSKLKAFEHGGVDYVTKPFNKDDLLARVEAHLHLKSLQDELQEKNQLLADREIHLSELVRKKTAKIENLTIGLVSVLENANLANDDDTGNHIKRVSEFSTLLAGAYGCEQEFVKRIRLYASLHDVGKVGISDAILKKPGKYTSEEFEEMKKHVLIGATMLENSEIDGMAQNIALYHHEKWDGSGYISGLSGENIPLEARLVALADAYDALTSRRVYKKAFSLAETEKILIKERGSHFDPRIVDLYFEQRKKMIEIKHEFGQEE